MTPRCGLLTRLRTDRVESADEICGSRVEEACQRGMTILKGGVRWREQLTIFILKREL